MAVTTIALYASPPSSVCSTPYPSQINSHSSDFDLNSRSSSSTTPSQKSVIGGLSCLFSSPSAKHASPTSFAGDELGTLRHERNEDLSSSFSYSPYSSLSSSLKCRDQSPVSVFQGPVSCNASGTSRSPPGKTIAEWSGEVHLQTSFRAHRDGLFSGFVRNALGSCIDYESPSFPISGLSHKEDSSVSLVDEFNFGAPEEDFGESCGPYSKELLLGAQAKHKVFYDEFVVKAFYEAERAHRGQMRASGDPYLQHCVETAVLLATIGASATVVAAGLLHDTLDDSFMNYEYIFRTFGAGIADLVEGVSKLSHLSKLARESNIASKTVEADRLHTMFLAMADARAVLIKLADRLHNMMTLEALPLIKRQRFAKETLEIFAPLANRLGISSWKEELENLCFKHLNPEQHEELSSELIESFDESKITSAVEKLEQALEDGEVSYHCLLGRHKSLYSTYRKMLKKKLTMDEIHDIHGLRLIVENKEDCYAALKIVHQLWPKVPGKLKDYIIHPKFNGYQSLHTIVMSEGMVPLEVQIRSKEMHLQAEFGFAAHWRYKEGDCKHSSFVLQMVEWARWVVSWQCESMSKERRSSFGADLISSSCSFPSHNDDCPYCYMPNCDQDSPVFVVMIENDKMSVQEFEANSTVMQLLERVGRGSSKWSPYGFPVKEELRPRLNHKPVSDSSLKLKMGDVVELTPAIPNKRLTKYREEFQRMYDQDLTASSRIIAWRS